MAEEDVKCKEGEVLRMEDPQALIPKRKAEGDELCQYVLARVMVSALQAELKSVTTGFTVGAVGRSNRVCDRDSVSSTMGVIGEMADALETSDMVLSRFSDLGLEPNESRSLYCTTLLKVLAILDRTR